MLLRTLLAAAAALAALPAPARACGSDFDRSAAAFPPPRVRTERVPPNVVFTTGGAGWRDGERAVPLSRDATLSSLFVAGGEVHRLEETPAAGTVLTREEPCDDDRTCVTTVVFDEAPDTTPPSKAVLRDVRMMRMRDAGDAACATRAKCGNQDELGFRVEGEDDRAPRAHLSLAGRLGRTAGEVRAKTSADALWSLEAEGPTAFSMWSFIPSGIDVNPQESFCFAVALVDWAGNVGDYSEPHCLNPQNENDPSVVMADPGGGCTAATATLWALFGVLALPRRRR